MLTSRWKATKRFDHNSTTYHSKYVFLSTQGVNAIDYFQGGDKPYIISGADDRLVKVWDYQNKTCVQTLEGHAQNVSCVLFHPELPIILSGSEDGEHYLDTTPGLFIFSLSQVLYECGIPVPTD